jgi:hypothetical protein
MTATTTANLAPAFNRLREITDLPADWDSYGAIPPSPAAIRKARWILENIASRSCRWVGQPNRGWSVLAPTAAF